MHLILTGMPVLPPTLLQHWDEILDICRQGAAAAADAAVPLAVPLAPTVAMPQAWRPRSNLRNDIQCLHFTAGSMTSA